jgi:hypothetical protein
MQSRYGNCITELVTEMPRCFSSSIQSEVAWRLALRALHRAGDLDRAAEQQQLFGQRGLAGVRVGNDGEGTASGEFLGRAGTRRRGGVGAKGRDYTVRALAQFLTERATPMQRSRSRGQPLWNASEHGQCVFMLRIRRPSETMPSARAALDAYAEPVRRRSNATRC